MLNGTTIAYLGVFAWLQDREWTLPRWNHIAELTAEANKERAAQGVIVRYGKDNNVLEGDTR
jgi:hypothetical protein